MKLGLKCLGAIAALGGVAAGRWSAGTVDASDKPLVVLYYEEWSEWVRGYHVSQLDKVILSRNLPVRNWVINLAFLTWAAGDCHIAPTDEEAGWSKQDPGMGTSSWFDPGSEWGSPTGSMAGLIALRQKYPYIKLLPSIGGWSASNTYSDCVREKPDVMVQAAIDFVRVFHFDGIDLDWEYPECPGTEGRPGDCGCQKEPVCPDSSNHGNSGDWENYKNFLVKLRAGFDKLETEVQRRLYITAAIGMNPKHIEGNLPWTAPMPVEWICDNDYFDWVNLMTYDMYGPWSKKTGHLAPLYAQPDDPDSDEVQLSTADSVERVLARCSRPEKLMMGLATYGKSWANVPATGRIPGLWQESENTHTDIITTQMSWGPDGTWEYGTLSFWQINNVYLKSNTCKKTWDDVAKAPTIHCATNPTTVSFSDWKTNTFISYEDGDSWAAKMEYARRKGMGGAIIWASSDTGNDSGSAATNDAVDQLYGGLFRGWNLGKTITVGKVGANGSYSYKMPAIAEFKAQGVDIVNFPCPYPVGRHAYNWKNDNPNPNMCYDNGQTYDNATPYPIFTGSGTQDKVGKDVILIAKSPSTGDDTPVTPATTTSTTPKPTEPTLPTLPSPPSDDKDTVEKCKAADFPFDSYANGYCAEWCGKVTTAECSSYGSLAECVKGTVPACGVQASAWAASSCDNAGFADFYMKESCVKGCKELATSAKIAVCGPRTSLVECFVATSPLCTDKSWDVPTCKAAVSSACASACETVASSANEVTTCRMAGHTTAAECVKNLKCTGGDSNGDDGADDEESCKARAYKSAYSPYCGGLCTYYAYNSELCASYANLGKCVTALGSGYCDVEGESNAGGSDVWAVATCNSEFSGTQYEDFCVGYCAYYGNPAYLPDCKATSSTLAECVKGKANGYC